MSVEKRARILPLGVDSNQVMGACRMRCMLKSCRCCEERTPARENTTLVSSSSTRKARHPLAYTAANTVASCDVGLGSATYRASQRSLSAMTA